MRACSAPPGTGDVDDLVLDRRQQLLARVLGAGDLGRRVVDGEHRAVGVPAVRVGVFEHAEVRAAILPVQRRPEKEGLARLRLGGREPGIGDADAPHSPTAVLGAVDACGVDAHGLAVVADLALPLAELREAGDVHHETRAGKGRLTTLLHTRGARGEGEVGGDAGLVVVEGDADRAHRLEHVDRERADLQIGRLERRAPRPVEACCSPSRTMLRPQSRMPRFG